jgi:hypothetical protein
MSLRSILILSSNQRLDFRSSDGSDKKEYVYCAVRTTVIPGRCWSPIKGMEVDAKLERNCIPGGAAAFLIRGFSGPFPVPRSTLHSTKNSLRSEQDYWRYNVVVKPKRCHNTDLIIHN